MRRVGRAVAAVAVGVLLSATGCTKQPTPGADGGASTSVDGPTLPLGEAPTADEVSEVAGLVWPPSMEGYRSVRLDPGELDVTFRLPNAEVARFVEDSGFDRLQPGRRIVDQHMSPLWEVNPPDGSTTAWAESKVDGILRRLEVVTASGAEAGDATVRLVIAAT